MSTDKQKICSCSKNLKEQLLEFERPNNFSRYKVDNSAIATHHNAPIM